MIGCSGGRITSVALGALNIKRGLAFNASDESSLGLFDGLQHIGLRNSALTGPVPKWLLNLTSLNFVDFGNNKLTGTVPTEFGALTGLTQLDFFSNQLTGTVATELGALTALTELRSLTALTELRFDINGLTGTVPTELGALSGLSYLAFSANQLTGAVPAELGALTALTDLRFDRGTQLTGTVPALPSKQYIGSCCLSPNNFSCPLPLRSVLPPVFSICFGEPGVTCV
jgi:hypothetical protein